MPRRVIRWYRVAPGEGETRAILCVYVEPGRWIQRTLELSGVSSIFIKDIGSILPTSRSGPNGRIRLEKHPNAIKRALHYKELLDSGQVDSQGELSRLSGTPRTTISAYLRLLGLDEEVRAEALNLSVEDERVARLTELRLRHLVGLQPAEQLRQFRALLDATEPHEASRRIR